MADLKLPEIRPVGPITSAASDIERAGAQFNAGLQSLAQIPLEYDKAKVIREQIDARDIYNQTIRDALRVARKQTAFAPDDVRRLFGHDVPPEVRLNNEDGSPRTAIPAYEVTGALFERMSQVGKDRARLAISGEGWRRKWDEHARTLEGEARGEALKIIDAQRAGDRRQWAINKLDRYKDERDWVAREAALRDPTFEISDHERSALLADQPKLEVTSDLYQRIDTFDPTELAKAEAEVRANRPMTNRGQEVPLSPQEQNHFLALIEHQRRALSTAAKAEAEAKHDQTLQSAEAFVAQALVVSGERAPASVSPAFSPAALIKQFPGLKMEEYNRLIGTLDKAHQPDIADTNQGIATFRAWEASGFRNVTLEKMQSLRGWVSRDRFDQYLAIFNHARGNARASSALSASDEGLIKEWLKPQGLDPNSAEYATALDDARLAVQQYKMGKPPGESLLTAREVGAAISHYKRPDSTALKGAIFKSVMTPEEKDKVLNLDRPEVKAAWENAYQEVTGDRPPTTLHLQDFVSKAIESGAADKTADLIRRTDRGAVTAEQVALVFATASVHGAEISESLGDKSSTEAILQRAVDMNAAPGSEAKKAAAEAEVKAGVQGEQLRGAAKDAKAADKARVAAEEKARADARNAKPTWVIEADTIFSKQKAKELDAVPHPRSMVEPPSSGIRFGAPPDPRYDAEEMKRYKADQATVLARIEAREIAAREAYRAYLRRNGFDPDEKYWLRDALPFSAWYPRWEKGEAPQ